MVVFEDWIEKPFSKANQEPESAINLAELYWQGLDLDLIKLLIYNLEVFLDQSRNFRLTSSEEKLKNCFKISKTNRV